VTDAELLERHTALGVQLATIYATHKGRTAGVVVDGQQYTFAEADSLTRAGLYDVELEMESRGLLWPASSLTVDTEG